MQAQASAQPVDITAPKDTLPDIIVIDDDTTGNKPVELHFKGSDYNNAMDNNHHEVGFNNRTVISSLVIAGRGGENDILPLDTMRKATNIAAAMAQEKNVGLMVHFGFHGGLQLAEDSSDKKAHTIVQGNTANVAELMEIVKTIADSTAQVRQGNPHVTIPVCYNITPCHGGGSILGGIQDHMGLHDIFLIGSHALEANYSLDRSRVSEGMDKVLANPSMELFNGYAMMDIGLNDMPVSSIIGTQDKLFSVRHAFYDLSNELKHLKKTNVAVYNKKLNDITQLMMSPEIKDYFMQFDKDTDVPAYAVYSNFDSGNGVNNYDKVRDIIENTFLNPDNETSLKIGGLVSTVYNHNGVVITANNLVNNYSKKEMEYEVTLFEGAHNSNYQADLPEAIANSNNQQFKIYDSYDDIEFQNISSYVLGNAKNTTYPSDEFCYLASALDNALEHGNLELLKALEEATGTKNHMLPDHVIDVKRANYQNSSRDTITNDYITATMRQLNFSRKQAEQHILASVILNGNVKQLEQIMPLLEKPVHQYKIPLRHFGSKYKNVFTTLELATIAGKSDVFRKICDSYIEEYGNKKLQNVLLRNPQYLEAGVKSYGMMGSIARYIPPRALQKKVPNIFFLSDVAYNLLNNWAEHYAVEEGILPNRKDITIATDMLKKWQEFETITERNPHVSDKEKTHFVGRFKKHLGYLLQHGLPVHHPNVQKLKKSIRLSGEIVKYEKLLEQVANENGIKKNKAMIMNPEEMDMIAKTLQFYANTSSTRGQFYESLNLFILKGNKIVQEVSTKIKGDTLKIIPLSSAGIKQLLNIKVAVTPKIINNKYTMMDNHDRADFTRIIAKNTDARFNRELKLHQNQKVFGKLLDVYAGKAREIGAFGR